MEACVYLTVLRLIIKKNLACTYIRLFFHASMYYITSKFFSCILLCRHCTYILHSFTLATSVFRLGYTKHADLEASKYFSHQKYSRN